MAVFTDGSQYVGKFSRDVMDGQGTYSWAQGHEYKGAFKEGQMDGSGEFSHANGHTMTGLFRRNLFQKVSISTSFDNACVCVLMIIGEIFHKSS